MFYRKNLPLWERTIRLLLGVAIIVYALVALPLTALGYLIIALGITAILTSLLGFCPMCALVGRK